MSYIKTLSAEAHRNLNLVIDLLRMKSDIVINDYVLASVLALVSKECGFIPQDERSYRNTDSERIKEIFAVQLRDVNVTQVSYLKKNDVAFFNKIYGGRFGNAPDEGHKFFGRGLNQITFKRNYSILGSLIGVDLVKNPEKLNEISVATKALWAYLERRFTMSAPIVEQRYGAKHINDFRNLTLAGNAIYNANAGFEKDTRNSKNGGYKVMMERLDEFYFYVKEYGQR